MSGPEYAQRLVEVERELWALQAAMDRLAQEWEARCHAGMGSGQRNTYRRCAADLRLLRARSDDRRGT